MLRSVGDLEKLRGKASNALRLRNGHASARVVIAMGTCGIAAGAREVLLAVMEELAARSIEGVKITQTGCRGLCEREPMMEVQKPGLPVVTYGDLDPEKARVIVAQHLGAGVVVEEWVITQAGRPGPTA